MAYGFEAKDGPGLRQLAGELIDLSAAVTWELRFYQRKADNRWQCHGRWAL
ncbi:MAG: hypothetical protein HC800_05380 [Phormidesmis sp. RL_2_1]|nr:hypothetical protein [Phormidesmis sp. RL_2_1]